MFLSTKKPPVRGRFPFFLERRAVFRERTDGAALRKEVMPMVQFLWDAAAQAVAGIVVALFVYWLNRR